MTPQDDRRTREERYGAFIAITMNGVWRVKFDEPIRLDLPAEEQFDAFIARGYIAESNQAMAELLGFADAALLIGHRMRGLVRQSWLRAAVAARFRLKGFESEARGLGDRPRWAAFDSIPIVENGRMVRLWGVARDITEQRRTQQMIFNIERGVSAATGDRFFRLLVEHLATTLEADFAFVGELMPPNKDSVRMLAVFGEGKEREGIEYDPTSPEPPAPTS